MKPSIGVPAARASPGQPATPPGASTSNAKGDPPDHPRDENGNVLSFQTLADAVSAELDEKNSATEGKSAEQPGESGEGAGPEESTETSDNEQTADFWTEVHNEALALMHDQLDAELEAAREAGLAAAKAETEHVREELADSEAEAQDLREELEASQLKQRELEVMLQKARSGEDRAKLAERRDITALQEDRDRTRHQANLVGQQAAKLAELLRETQKELEGFKKRALEAEGLIEESKAACRSESEARQAAEAEIQKAKDERKAAVRAARDADVARQTAEKDAWGAIRKAGVTETNAMYLKNENSRLKSEGKELRKTVHELQGRLDQMANEGFGRSAVSMSYQDDALPRGPDTQDSGDLRCQVAQLSTRLAESEAREAALYQRLQVAHACDRNGQQQGEDKQAETNSRGHGDEQRIGALLEQSITLWNEMHSVVDALEEAEKAASAGRPRPANVERAVATAARWSDPPRVPPLSLGNNEPGTASTTRQISLPPLGSQTASPSAAARRTTPPSSSGPGVSRKSPGRPAVPQHPPPSRRSPGGKAGPGSRTALSAHTMPSSGRSASVSRPVGMRSGSASDLTTALRTVEAMNSESFGLSKLLGSKSKPRM